MSTRRQMTKREALVSAMRRRFKVGKMVNPIPGFPMTFPYGVRDFDYQLGYHTGEDHSTHGEIGKPVYAVRPGVIVGQSIGSSYGKVVCQEFTRRVSPFRKTRMRAYFCHLNTIVVRPGQHVEAGTLLGYSGNTGNSTGPHLHLEVRTPPFAFGDDVHPLYYKRRWKQNR